MTLQQAITKYRQLKVAEAATKALNGNIRSINEDTVNLFHEVNENLGIMRNDYTDDPFSACLLFSEMSIRQIGELAPFLAYYYGTLAQSQDKISAHSKIDARRMRLFAMFKNLETFDRAIMLAHAPISGYTGKLNDQEFFDFLIMSDVYLVWDSDDNSTLLKSLKSQTLKNIRNHSKFSKDEIMKEGEKAHKALFTIIEMACGPK
ncbi:MAG: hypothetical protein K2L17_08075 [Muribaculaceae bacterium]|nr:hypothetical protein [Muribaculaceae bacterium]